jgi:3D (Asp-Asp-Asp) domain-containing protein
MMNFTKVTGVGLFFLLFFATEVFPKNFSLTSSEVFFQDRLVFEIPAFAGNPSSQQRVSFIENRLLRLASAGIPLSEIQLVNENGRIEACCRKATIFFVTEEDGRHYEILPEELARKWLKQVEVSLKLTNAEVATTLDGMASWYGHKFHGRRTASGTTFDMNELTAAHKTLPFGSEVMVTNIHNGLSVLVKINDRGPFIKGRIIDLSRAAAQVINLTGTAPVLVEVLK